MVAKPLHSTKEALLLACRWTFLCSGSDCADFVVHIMTFTLKLLSLSYLLVRHHYPELAITNGRELELKFLVINYHCWCYRVQPGDEKLVLTATSLSSFTHNCKHSSLNNNPFFCTGNCPPRVVSNACTPGRTAVGTDRSHFHLLISERDTSPGSGVRLGRRKAECSLLWFYGVRCWGDDENGN